MGALDFAGGTVVHINAGMAALAAALVLGKRVGYPNKMSPPHNLPFSGPRRGPAVVRLVRVQRRQRAGRERPGDQRVRGDARRGRDGGPDLGAHGLIFNKRPTVLGMITGAVAGLVAITPASGFVTPMGALGIGVGAGVICYLSVAFMKAKLGYDDSLDAFGVHGVGGIWGAIATGLWATKAVNPAGADGLFYGNPAQFVIQLKAALITVVYSFVVSFVLLKLVDLVMGLRADEQEERIGLDLTQHREAATPCSTKEKGIPTMKYIIAIIQPDRLDEVLQLLTEKEIHLVTVSNVMGRGRQKGIAEVYRSHKEAGSLLKKVKLEIAVNEAFVKPTIDAITKGGRTGQIGDGKIFVLDLQECIRIRTGETGGVAIG